MTVVSELLPDQRAAHDFLSELRTRIAVQRLPNQFGVEARALESLVELFELARQSMKDHPGCERFARRATEVLNVELRPVTAKWHRALEAGLLDTRDGANDFRVDLMVLQKQLKAFSLELQEMAYGSKKEDVDTPLAVDPKGLELLLAPLKFGIVDTDRRIDNVSDLNKDEGAEISLRRDKVREGAYDPQPGLDAAGLALSGGGIRSATFCAGVLQVFADRGLLPQFDFLSTVSGGGYIGAFITSWTGRDGELGHLAKARGPDTEAFRHVRQHARYLSATDRRSRWSMLIGTLAGMALNWTAPLAVVAAVAFLFALVDKVAIGILEYATSALAIVTALALAIYGVSLRFRVSVRAAIACLGGLAAITILSFVLLLTELGYAHTLRLWHGLPAVSIATLATALPAAIRFLSTSGSPEKKKRTAEVLLYLAGVAVPVLALACYYLLRATASLHFSVPHLGLVLVGAVAAVSAAFALWALDINATSPHKLYRDALAGTFIMPTGKGGGDEPLYAVNDSGRAPYHLINATVNLPSSVSPVLKDRRGDFFLFSKHWTGSPATKYRPTQKWKLGGRDISLATAMAVSGAAASPHMGLASKPTLTALMTFLNIRLGLWLQNTSKGGSGVPSFGCLMREMCGAGMSESKPWLNVTDGGHIENLGIYELLRRRCKFIVSVDGEADPQLTFHGNLTLVRHAQIDFGIRIDPRLDDIRLGSNGFSRSHAQLFKITYPAVGTQEREEAGLLLYLKLSLTGNEAELLKRYRSIHPDFPHQSTADQFYDEEQFEAYRQLGVHVAEGVFSSALLTSEPKPATIAEWFRQLAMNMLEPSAVPTPD